MRCNSLGLALGGLGFFLPFSSAGVSIAMGALLALALARPRATWRQAPWKEPVMAGGLVLLAYITVHTLWTSGLQEASWHAVNKYQELWMAPLLLVLLRDVRHREVFMRGLVIGAVLLALAHWAALVASAYAYLLNSRRISAGFGLAICAFLVLMCGHSHDKPWRARALAAFLALTVLFAVDGRTGHVVLLVLAGCAGWSRSPRRWRLAGALGASLVTLALALSSSAVNTRLQETIAGSQLGPDGTLTSTGIRIQLARLAFDLSKQYAFTGAGFANYPTVHEQAAQRRYGGNPATQPYLHSGWVRASNPHNEYAMQLVGGGIVSLALFLAWLGLAAREAARARSRAGTTLAGIVLAFCVGCLFNAMLLDFVEGHFYMALLACLLAQIRDEKRKDLRAGAIQRILVVTTRQIGDVLLTTPLIRAARKRWPQARIDVLGFHGTLGMLRGNPDVQDPIETPPRLGWAGSARLVRRLWRDYDLALVTDAGDRAHLMAWLAAPLRCGIIPPEGGSNWWKKRLLVHAVVAAGDLGTVHVTAEKLALLGPWREGMAQDAPPVVVPRGTPLPAQVQSQLMPGAVLLHAPSMWPYKQWPLSHFETMVKGLLAQGRQVVLTGSGCARDQECIAPLRALGAPPQLLDVSGQLDFNQLVTLFERAALYIGPDTSVSHLAAAAGVPVIAIFGPTNPQRWAPWPGRASAQVLFARSALVQQAGNVTLLQSGLACVPCGRAGCEDHRQSRSDCLPDITPQRVMEQAMKLLAADPKEIAACAD
jgi:heptosyltransferase-3